MNGFETVLYDKVGNVVWITINRPDARNAMNNKMRDELTQVFRMARDDNSVHVVVITGAGDKDFCAGADVGEYAKSARSAPEQLEINTRVHPFTVLRQIPKPVIAMVNGTALGGGCEMVLACDLAIASENAVFGQAEIRVGLIPGAGGTQVLPRLVGEKRAKELIFTGRSFMAPEALQMGVVNQVVTHEKLRETTGNLIAVLLRRSPVMLKLAKQAVNKAFETTLSAGLVWEKDIFALCFSTEDQKEGGRAFLEKREPNYRGR